MRKEDFGKWSHRAAEWAADYHAGIGERPVRAQVQPGEIAARIAEAPPAAAEPMETIFADFVDIIPDGMTHWQHPRFFAYFPSNSAPAALVAEQLAVALASQCMLWQTSPAATELETRMVDWLRQATGLPEGFKGVLQDTASSATLCAILTMRERALEWQGNRQGLAGLPQTRVYASTHTHSSIDKAIWIAGLGQDNLVRIPTTDDRAMDVEALQAAITADRKAGLLPAGIVTCVGGTSMGACDNVRAVCELARREDLYTHVDAAWAGSAMICPEFRPLWEGVELADSIVFNPHKWLGAPMECSCHFVRDPETLVRTLAIQPEYLRTHGRDGIINYSEWGIQLGRRFRALKLWFLMRAYGIEGLQAMIRRHVEWTAWLAEQLRREDDFEIVTEPILALFTFRHVPAGVEDLDASNRQLIERINDDGRIYLTQTLHDGQFVIRFSCGHMEMQEEDIRIARDVIIELARA
ncbi:MAG: aspartate aminotransferase family protein [Gammaproteobacteria bacterium]|nr:MAG: aspartate aminotransferase family protein [Gammaproteobacteria bacterium]